MSDIFDHEMEAWDRLEAGEEDNNGHSKPNLPKYKYCGLGDGRLKWMFLNFKWRLLDLKTKTPHICREYKQGQ